MPEAERIADQLSRAYSGPAWHGPALKELLSDLTAERAAAHPLPQLHSIWEIVLHVNSWQEAALGALQGRAMPTSSFPEDWPVIEGKDEQTWHTALERLERGNLELVAATREFSESRLGEMVPGRDYSFYFLLHGVTQHNLYHAGQVAVLKKA
jgi:hypothetical protein